MIERLIDCNLNFLKKYISCDEDTADVYRYSLRIIYSYVIDVLVLMSLALVTHKVIETIIMLITFAVMQVYGGGYHANTKMGCLSIMVAGWFIGVFVLARVVTIHWCIVIVVALLFTVLVFVFTPVLNPKHPISGDVYKRSKKIVRVFCLVIDVVAVVCIFGNVQVIYSSVSVMMLLYSASLMAYIESGIS
ncbi:MAG: accessory gene regulator B family protein [Clostridiales bacterium]|nr:accessory gene regulator B family protein [Clostridiales bacterium]